MRVYEVDIRIAKRLISGFVKFGLKLGDRVFIIFSEPQDSVLSY